MEVVNKKSNLILLTVATILILPFIVISFFTNPSVDDYSFYEFSEKLGYWGAQKFWYTSWTGRYFSSAILAAHPMYFKASCFLCNIFTSNFVFVVFQFDAIAGSRCLLAARFGYLFVAAYFVGFFSYKYSQPSKA